jgi:hypothetical protein
MFEPLLGLLTWGYVAAECAGWPNWGTPWSAAGSAGEVMGLRSNPFRASMEMTNTRDGQMGERSPTQGVNAKSASSVLVALAGVACL